MLSKNYSKSILVRRLPHFARWTVKLKKSDKARKNESALNRRKVASAPTAETQIQNTEPPCQHEFCLSCLFKSIKDHEWYPKSGASVTYRDQMEVASVEEEDGMEETSISQKEFLAVIVCLMLFLEFVFTILSKPVIYVLGLK